ncbi:MAG: hypothetical protein ACJAW3_000695 [Lentimonas sp.]
MVFSLGLKRGGGMFEFGHWAGISEFLYPAPILHKKVKTFL